MLMNSKIIHSEMMKNDTPGFDDMEHGCNLDDCSIRVLYLDIKFCFVLLIQQFGTENTLHFRE